MADAVITVQGLRKRYGQHEAVKGIDFTVDQGEVFGFLGTNGAGKTTTIEILEGYRSRTAGVVSVLGVDPARPTTAWRERIGLVLQESELDPLHTVRETVAMFACYYRHPRPVDDTIALVGLAEQRDARVGSLSGGQKRRVDVALGIVGDPDLVFLDEPTTGFDPQARRDAWNMIEGLRQLGKTIFLTTHYMDEAQHLADRLCILRDGVVVAGHDLRPHEPGERWRRRPLPDPGRRHRRRGSCRLRRGAGGLRHRDHPEDRPSPEDALHVDRVGGRSGSGAGGSRGDPALARRRVPRAHRRRPVVSLPGLLLRQTRYALVGSRRNPRAMVLTVVMPIVLLVLFASVFTGKARTTRVDGLLISIDAYFTAGIAAYSIMLIGFSSLLISIVTAREGGLLKRYRGTPMPSGVFLAARILQTMVTIAVMVAVLLAIGAIAYDVELDATAVFAFVVYVVVGTATMCALGLARSRVATNVDVASTVGPFIAVILAFISGVFVPVTELPQWLVDVGRVFPLAHLAEGLQRALTPAAQGSRIDAGNLAVLALWGVVAMTVAIRRFRWEPLAAGT